MAPTITTLILGAGGIGTSFAAVFRDAGATVHLVDPDAGARDAAPGRIDAHAEAIALSRQSKGGAGAVHLHSDMAEGLAAADLVQECGPEDLDFKQGVFRAMLDGARADTVLATASSAIPMSRIVPDAGDQRRCLVAHPVNPPAVLRVVELCPAPGTDPATMTRATELLTAVGFVPVAMRREVEGFLLNRLQSAVLREAYRLVDEGVADVDAIDTVMRLGLGPRWALSGPFETAELNTPGGIVAHAARMGPAYARIGAARGETVDWYPDLVARVAAERETLRAGQTRQARRDWRTRAVARLVAARDALMDDPDGR
ncbi:3-hydroxyacyl-CoA dehydrogenase NAD-binding domain-containing protein [Jannaschia sp. KMU-145]|uniref:3-hydroxyacyl-CoA dehydrogenase NAD-binding domain-containing protein n=1 Tax=Jannaschia halovivens TaxID=3388667 RepID=UPI00396B3362